MDELEAVDSDPEFPCASPAGTAAEAVPPTLHVADNDEDRFPFEPDLSLLGAGENFDNDLLQLCAEGGADHAAHLEPDLLQFSAADEEELLPDGAEGDAMDHGAHREPDLRQFSAEDEEALLQDGAFSDAMDQDHAADHGAHRADVAPSISAGVSIDELDDSGSDPGPAAEPAAVAQPAQQPANHLEAALEVLRRVRMPGGRRACGLLCRASQSMQLRQTHYSAIADSWNAMQLRHGDLLLVDPLFDGAALPAGTLPEGEGHPNSWTATGVTRVAFSELASGSPKHKLPTRRVLDCQALVSLAGSAGVNEWWHQVDDWLKTQSPNTESAVLMRGLDCTPLVISFGEMRDLLVPVARYYWRDRQATAVNGDKGGCWRKLTYEEMRRMGSGFHAKAGVLELCAQTFAVNFDTVVESEGRPHRITIAEDLAVPPCFVGKADGSTLFAAMTNSSFGSWPAMVAFASRFKALLLVLSMDSAGSNQRMACEFLRRALEHNRRVLTMHDPRGLILVLVPLCFGHSLHNAIDDTYRPIDLIPQLHAMEYVHRNRSNYSTALRSLFEMIDAELDFIPDVAPPAAYGAHTELILKATLLRPMRCRGREYLRTVNAEEKLQAASNCRRTAERTERSLVAAADGSLLRLPALLRTHRRVDTAGRRGA